MPLVRTDVQKAMLTPSLVWAYSICGSMAGILYASGLSLSRCHWMDRAISRRWLVRQEALAALGAAAIVRLGRAGVNGRGAAASDDRGGYVGAERLGGLGPTYSILPQLITAPTVS